MEDIICPECGSINTFFSKKRNIYVCEDCECEFTNEAKVHGKKVFFSYAHDENEWLVAKLKKDLESQGYDIWIDRSEIKSGEDWRQSITNGLLESIGVISFLSKHSVRVPGVCLDEIRIALSVKGGNIRTVLLEDESSVSVPSTLSSIQWLDMSQWQTIRKNEGQWESWYQEKLSELKVVIDKDDFSSFSGDMSRINDILKVNIADTKEQLLISKPFYGRSWLISTLEAWRKDSVSSKVFLLYGAPGIGKSSFAANQLHYNENALCGFFCEWDKESQKDPRNVAKSIALKISSKLPDFRRLLLSRLKTRGKAFYESLTAPELFEQLLTQPLSELIDGGREKQIIIIDGLDETETNGDNELASILAENAAKLPKWIGLLITSRPEGNIKRAFARFEPFICDPTSSLNEADIREYLSENLQQEIEHLPNRQRVLDSMVKSCDGNFLYASMFVESVKLGSIDVKNMSGYPKGLDAIYVQNFRRAFADRNDYKIPRTILEVIAATDSMPLELLCDVAKVDQYDFITFREKIGSILVESIEYVGPKKEKCCSYSFAHKSVQDWMTDSERSGHYYVDIKSGTKRTVNHFRKIVKKSVIDAENQICGLKEHIDRYVQIHIIDFWKKLEDWPAIEQFLLETDTPLFPYWKCINAFPVSWNMSVLLNALWRNSECTSFFNRLQRLGERKFVSDILEKLKDINGIRAFNNELFETYVDIVHLGGGYKKAVALYEDYLSSFSESEVHTDPTLLHYDIRRIHHSMFFAPVKDLVNESLDLLHHMDQDKTPKDYNEILFLIGGNLGVLSGDFAFAKEWLGKAERFANKIGDKDFQSRAARKKADLLCTDGAFEEAIKLINSYITLDSTPNTRYEIYLLGALAEAYRQMGNYDLAECAYNKLLEITLLKGLTGWQCHAYLGLANLYVGTNSFDFEKSNKSLEMARKIYNKSEQAWGQINSDIVDLRIRQSLGKLNAEEIEASIKVKEYATHLQYAYEVKALDAIINDQPLDYRLLFL